MNPARAVCGLGSVLVVVTTAILTGGTVAPFVLGLLAWALVPYAVVWGLTRVTRDQWVQTGAALAVLAGEIYVRSWLFFVARGSTSPLLLLFSPLYLLTALPAGAALGWGIGRMWRRAGAPGRAAIAAAGVACAAVAALVIVRPAVLPYRLGTLISVKERVGEPRVVAGEAFFAVLGTASKEVGRARLVVFSAAGDVVYDEILPRPARMMAAPDGAERRQMLLLADGNGLVAYRK